MANATTVFGYTQSRSISRPLFFDNESIEDNPEIKSHFLFIPLKELPLDIPIDTVNPRKPNLKALPCKRMFETLERDPEHFTDCNRGLLLIAQKVTHIKDAHKVIIEWGIDEEGNPIGGLVDGGHTYAVLKQAQKNNPSLANLPISICILEGVDEFSSLVARARNTSVQVKETSIANLEKEFDLLKNALGEYASKVIFYENEDQIDTTAIVPVEEVLSVLTALNRGLYNEETQPTISYSGSTSCFNKWLNKSHRPTYEKLYPIVPSVIELYEFLQINLEKFAKDGGGAARFGRIKGIDRLKKGNKESLPFTEKSTDCRISKAFLMPIIASLRFLLIEKDGKWEWELEPKAFLEKHGADLVSKLFNAHSNECASNPNKTGKSRMLWENLANAVRLFKMEDLGRG